MQEMQWLFSKAPGIEKVMKTVARLFFLSLTLCLAACAGGTSGIQGPGASNWETMKYSDFAVLEPNSLLRMGK
jgi:starvation-inducible outer membrane lipoprotein